MSDATRETPKLIGPPTRNFQFLEPPISPLIFALLLFLGMLPL
jgi:hypothetical protein